MVYPEINKIIEISNELIVSVNDCGIWINLSPSAITMQNDLIESLIKSTVEILEDYTWLSLRRTKFEAYYDINYESDSKLLIQRAPVIDITDIEKIEYLNNDQWVEFDRGAMTIDGLYDNTSERVELRQWASIYFKENINYQNRVNANNIKVTFTVGYDPLETDTTKKIPERIKTAIKEIVAFHYTNRGDCDSACNINGYAVPCLAKGLIDSISISKSIAGS